MQAAGEAVAEKTPEQERDEMQRYAKYLDDHLARSSQREDGLVDEVKSKVARLLDDKSALLKVECGEQMCRLTMRHKDSEAYRAFQSKALLGSAIEPKTRVWTGPLSFIVLERPETPARGRDLHGSRRSPAASRSGPIAATA